MLAGDFTAFASPACNAGRQIALRAPFVNNRVDPALFSPAALNLAEMLPSTTDPCGQVTWGSDATATSRRAIGKVDYQWRTNHTIFGRYMRTFVDELPVWDRPEATSSPRPPPAATARCCAEALHAGRHAGVRSEHGECAAVRVQPDRASGAPGAVRRRAVARRRRSTPISRAS